MMKHLLNFCKPCCIVACNELHIAVVHINPAATCKIKNKHPLQHWHGTAVTGACSTIHKAQLSMRRKGKPLKFKLPVLMIVVNIFRNARYSSSAHSEKRGSPLYKVSKVSKPARVNCFCKRCVCIIEHTAETVVANDQNIIIFRADILQHLHKSNFILFLYFIQGIFLFLHWAWPLQNRPKSNLKDERLYHTIIAMYLQDAEDSRLRTNIKCPNHRLPSFAIQGSCSGKYCRRPEIRLVENHKPGKILFSLHDSSHLPGPFGQCCLCHILYPSVTIKPKCIH